MRLRDFRKKERSSSCTPQILNLDLHSPENTMQTHEVSLKYDIRKFKSNLHKRFEKGTYGPNSRRNYNKEL